jgi:hypothetical protein
MNCGKDKKEADNLQVPQEFKGKVLISNRGSKPYLVALTAMD